MDELSEEDKMTVARARKIQRFLSQPFAVAEVFTGKPGRYVELKVSLLPCSASSLDQHYADSLGVELVSVSYHLAAILALSPPAGHHCCLRQDPGWWYG